MTQIREGPGPQTWAQMDTLDDGQGVWKKEEAGEAGQGI